MNCSMMSRIRNCILFTVGLFFLAFGSVSVRAADNDSHEAVLVVYSGRATQEDLKNVERLTEILTCQNVQVTLCEATRCEGMIQQYSRVIFFKVSNEETPVTPLIYRWKLGDHGRNKALFIGNELVKTYEDQYGTHMAARTTQSLIRGTFIYEGKQMQEQRTVVNVENPFFYQGSNVVSEGKIMWDGGEGYFYATKGDFSHISVSALEDSLVYDAYVSKLAEWMGMEQAPNYGRYLAVQNVYPFDNPEKLLSQIQMLTDRNLPFILVVRPIYDKADYPAMQRFCEVLRYAQGSGGTVILQTPIDQMESYSVDEMRKAITSAAAIYIDNGVYPMGILIPYNWMYNVDARETIGGFSTIFLNEEEDSRVSSDLFNEKTNQLGGETHQWISSDRVISLDASWDEEQIQEKLEALELSSLPILNLQSQNHTFWTEEDVVNYRNGILYVNEELTDLTYRPLEELPEFAYHRNTRQRFSKDLTAENQKLLVFVLVVAALFIAFIFIARNQNRKRFFYEEEDIEEYWENHK